MASVHAPVLPGGRAPAVPLRLAGVLAGAFLAERERWGLWLAPLLGAGVWLYFALAVEPPAWLPWPCWLALAFAAAALRRQRAALGLLLLLAVPLLGFHLAQARTAGVAAPVLEREIGPVRVEAELLEAEPLARGFRLLLGAPVVERLTPEATPLRLRVVATALAEPPPPGSRLRLLARLRPPPMPAAPGDYDFARAAWFQQLGGVGFAFGAPELLAGPPAAGGLREGWRRFWSGLRQRVAGRTLAALPPGTGGVAVALLTGQRGAVPRDALEAMRDAGLAHLLAISGLHIGLVAGTVFLAVRAGLALWPAVALRRPIKRYAAVAALAAAGIYLLLAGAPVPTQRAFLMTGLVLLGVLLDRTAITLRLVAWAAVVVLLLAPESLLSASFQLSFAAVVALVAGYEALRRRREARAGRREPRSPWLRPLGYLGGLMVTSLIAGFATAPMTLHHFDKIPLYGLAANLVAVPLTGFLVMPAAVVALLAMPLGLEALPLAVMGAGIEGVVASAEAVAGLEGAVLRAPAMAWWGFPACVLGGLWLCLWQRRWRLLGLLPLALGMASSAWTPPPDLLLSGEGRLAAVRAADGAMLFTSLRAERFSAEQWRDRAGVVEGQALPSAGDLTWPDLACDAFGCLLRRGGLAVALVFEGEALEEDCRRADLLLAQTPVPRGCAAGPRAPDLVIDSRDLRRDGGLAIWLEGKGTYRLRRVAAERGVRPWTAAGRAVR